MDKKGTTSLQNRGTIERRFMFEARLTKQAPNGYVDCYLCSFRCHIGDGRRGVCGVRENTAGTLYSLVYGKLIAEHIDPIEKKAPLPLSTGVKVLLYRNHRVQLQVVEG